MAEMKSAFERAMEKAEALGKASEEDLARWKYVPEGQKLAARYLKGEGDLIAELDKYDDSARKHIGQGAQGVLLGNIDLPRSDFIKARNKRALDAIKAIKSDRTSLNKVYANIKNIFDHYEQQGTQQRRQVYESLRQDFEARIRQAVEQQLGPTATTRINIDNHPQFQEEWRHALGQLDSQYQKLLDEYKKEVLNIP